MKWVNYTATYTPVTKEEARAQRAKVLAAVEKTTFKKPIGRFNARRLWFLFRHARWNPFRKRISIVEEINAVVEAERDSATTEETE